MPAPRPGSRKATIYNTFHDDGLEAALKQGADLQLASGTIRSWCSAWSKEDRAGSSEPRVKLRKAGDPEERVMPKKNKDFGSNWNPDAKDSVRLWTTDNMRWVWAPARVKVGDRFDFANGVYRVSESKGVLFVTQLRIKL